MNPTELKDIQNQLAGYRKTGFNMLEMQKEEGVPNSGKLEGQLDLLLESEKLVKAHILAESQKNSNFFAIAKTVFKESLSNTPKEPLQPYIKGMKIEDINSTIQFIMDGREHLMTGILRSQSLCDQLQNLEPADQLYSAKGRFNKSLHQLSSAPIMELTELVKKDITRAKDDPIFKGYPSLSQLVNYMEQTVTQLEKAVVSIMDVEEKMLLGASTLIKEIDGHLPHPAIVDEPQSLVQKLRGKFVTEKLKSPKNTL